MSLHPQDPPSYAYDFDRSIDVFLHLKVTYWKVHIFYSVIYNFLRTFQGQIEEQNKLVILTLIVKGAAKEWPSYPSLMSRKKIPCCHKFVWICSGLVSTDRTPQRAT